MTRIRLAAVMVLAVLAFGPGVARAAAWLTPAPLNVAAGVSNPSIALDGIGNTIATWQTAGPLNVVQGAHHVFGSSGFPALPDFANDSTAITPRANHEPLVVMNRAGNGLVLWVHDLGGADTQVQARNITAGGVVRSIQNVSGASGGHSSIAAAINENGDAVVAWKHNSLDIIEATSRHGAGGTFTAPKTLATFSTGGPSVAIDGTGKVLALWPSTAAPAGLHYDRTTVGSLWPAPNVNESIATGHTFTGAHLSANPSGQAVVAFQDTAGTTAISAASGTVSAGFGATPTVSTLSASAASGVQSPGATIDDAGNAVVGWAIGSAVQFSTRPSGGAFPAPAAAKSITPVPVPPANFELTGNGRGEVVAAWYSFEMPPSHNVVRAAVKPARSSTFGASRVISDLTKDTYDSLISLDQAGDAVVGLPLGSSGTPTGAQAVAYDGAPPQLGTLTGPGAVKHNATAQFSLSSAIDAFSGATVRWSFGDGSATASGLSVSHKFTRTGRFTVTVTATDGASNSAARTASLTVSGPTNCIVPKLKGKTLSQAKTALGRAHCKLGKVHRPKKPKHRRLRKLVVKSSSPGHGKVRAANTKVGLTMVEVPKPKHKKHKR